MIEKSILRRPFVKYYEAMLIPVVVLLPSATRMALYQERMVVGIGQTVQ